MNQIAERCSAYETVARAIRFIRDHATRQPELDQVAAHVGLSAYHLQRIFSTWAGISPKRFLQYLTREHAQSLLRHNKDVLATAYETGLSGPGRLHDLLVNCDAVTPGEVRSLGDRLTIAYGFGPTPFGRVIAGMTARGLCHLQFVDDDAAGLAMLRGEWPLATLRHNDEALAEIIENLFPDGNRTRRPHLLLRGTNFQIKVWEALMTIPPGEAVTYSTLSAIAGHPRAQRAVGSALARNRIAILIPCHRVIRENGEIGQYRWGSERKSALIAFESATTRR